MAELSVAALEAKVWWKSKTNWLHFLSALIVGLEMNLHLISPYVSEQLFAYWVLLVNVLGVLIRSVTTAPVTLTQTESERMNE